MTPQGLHPVETGAAPSEGARRVARVVTNGAPYLKTEHGHKSALGLARLIDYETRAGDLRALVTDFVEWHDNRPAVAGAPLDVIKRARRVLTAMKMRDAGHGPAPTI